MANNDYHIYLHSNGGQGFTSPDSQKTIPFSSRMEGEEVKVSSPISMFQSGMNGAYSTITGGAGKYVSQGASMLTKVNPYVALAVAVATIVSKVLFSGMESYSAYTGDYRHDIALNNLKTNVSNALNPYAHWRYQYKREIEMRNNNLKIEQERTLVGNLYTSYKGV